MFSPWCVHRMGVGTLVENAEQDKGAGGSFSGCLAMSLSSWDIFPGGFISMLEQGIVLCFSFSSSD